MRTLMSWSSGKDSAWALHVLRQQGVDVVGLVTTVNETHDRVAMHAVRRQLLQAQADAAGLPLKTIELPHPCSNEVYEQRMAAAIQEAREVGVDAMAFGDLYLEDVRAYRGRLLEGTGIAPLFPIWGLETAALAEEMVGAGVKAVVTCVDPEQLDPAFVGAAFEDMGVPEGVDPCGEGGEFHTFVWDAPCFSEPVAMKRGEIVERDGFWFADLVPVE